MHGAWLFAGLLNGVVIARAISTFSSDEEDRAEFVAHTAAVRHMVAMPASAFPSADGSAADADAVALLTCSADGTAKRWRFPGTGGGWQMTYQGHEGAVEALALDRGEIITGGADGTVRRWDGATGECKQSLKCHAGRITGLAVPTAEPGEDGSPPADAPQAGVVVTCSDDGLAKLIDPKAKAVLAIFSNEGISATDVTYLHPEVYVAGTDGKIRGFSLATAAPTRTLTGHTDAVNVVIPILGELFSDGDDRRLLMSDLARWAPKHEFRGHTQSVSAMSCDAAGELVTGAFDGTMRVWDRAGVVESFRQAAQLAAEEAAEKVRREKEAAKEAAAKAAAKKAKAGKGKGK